VTYSTSQFKPFVILKIKRNYVVLRGKSKEVSKHVHVINIEFMTRIYGNFPKSCL
jgi:hypothetical protein